MFIYSKKQWIISIFGLFLICGLFVNPISARAISPIVATGSQGISLADREALIAALLSQVRILQAQLLELQKTNVTNGVTYESGQLDTFKQLLNPLRAVAEIEYDDQGGYSNVCASSYVRATKKSIVSKDGVFNCAGAEDKYVIIGSLRTNATRSYCIDATGFSGTISASERIGAVGRTACNFDPDAKVQDPPPVTAADYTTGATDARVKIVTYTDFDCPFCKQFHDTLSTIVNEYDDVSVTYRHFPLEALFPNAKKIAITAECVGMLKNDNVFWKFADKLFASREINETTNINVVDSLAVKVGASRSKLVTCQLSDAAREAVEADMGEGLHSGVTGAPMSFIFLDDQVGRIDGAQPLAIVKQILDKLSE